jgi:hypothetical protein
MGLADFNIDGNLIKGALDGASGFLSSLKTLITGKVSPEVEADILQKSATLEASLNDAQVEVNKVEAGSKFLFVAGWRPFVGWVCGVALAYNYIFMPLFVYCWKLYTPTAPDMPLLETSELFTLLMGMLGLAGMRTLEKVKQ